MTLPNPELALHPTIRRAVFLFGWISVGHYLLRLLSFSFSNTFQFPFVMQIVAESNVPAEEVAWLLAWTEFAMINLFLFFVGVVLYGIILLREVVLLVSGGRAAMHFSLGAHYLFVGCAGALVLIYFIVNSSDAMGGRASAKLALVGLPGLGAAVALLMWMWIGFVVGGIFDPKKMQKSIRHALSQR